MLTSPAHPRHGAHGAAVQQNGPPAEGLTVADARRSAAWQARLVPALWEAWGAVPNILGALREYDAEARVIAAILPR